MLRGILSGLLVVGLPACGAGPIPSAPANPTFTPATTAEPASQSPPQNDVVVLRGRIVTMSEPAIAEALAYRDGTIVAVGSAADVMTAAGVGARIIDLGSNVAYPGFIDAHSHWIGDREVMGMVSPQQAMNAALERGWTSIGELWVDRGRLSELERLGASGDLPIRVDGYLALNKPAPTGEHLGSWFQERQPGASTSDRLRLAGVKITLDNGWGSQVWWRPQDLTETVSEATDDGWQVAVHTVSTTAHEMVLDAFAAALHDGPNTLHHRIEHAVQVTDEQLARMAALDLGVVIQLDGSASDWVLEPDYLGNLGQDTSLLTRWRDFERAGLHVAAASDAPWTFPDFALRNDVGRPTDQIAGGIDPAGRLNPETPAWVLDQTLTAEEGLAAVTTGAAWALNDEQHRGHLAAGLYADVTILSGNVGAATAGEIRDLQVVATIVGGVTEFCGSTEWRGC